MKTHVRGDNHLNVTAAMKEYAEKRLGRLDRYFDAPSSQEAQVTMSVKRGVHRVEIVVPLGPVMLRAEEKSGDMYASVDLVMDKLVKQLDKYKHRLGPRSDQRAKSTSGRSADRSRGANGDPDLEDSGESFPVVRVKSFEMKPMNVDEAILQMDLLGHDFFVFSNAETSQTNVVYRRSDGQYGLIQAM